MAARGITIDEVVVPSGSGHTHAGLLFGLRAYGSPVRVTGVCVRRNAQLQRSRILERSRKIAELLDMKALIEDRDIHQWRRGEAPHELLDTVRGAGVGSAG